MKPAGVDSEFLKLGAILGAEISTMEKGAVYPPVALHHRTPTRELLESCVCADSPAHLAPEVLCVEHGVAMTHAEAVSLQVDAGAHS